MITCLLTWLPLANGSILRSLSWSLLALSFLGLLACLYIWKSNVHILSSLALQLMLDSYPEPLQSTKREQTVLSCSQDLLINTVKQLEKESKINKKHIAALLLVWLVIASFGLIAEFKERVTYKYYNALVEETAPWEYWIYPEGKEKFHVTVCNDYFKPPFKTGMKLKKIIFVDRGPCWSLDPNQHAGFYIARESVGVNNGQPVKQ